jgi:hypothetical protein
VEVEHVNLKSSYSWLWGIPAVAAVGICGTLIYITQVPSAVRWSVFATALAIASAAFFTCWVVGFLFGIPQPVQGSATSTGNLQHDNTNLYQVSDWLTKIIVGVGLVEIGRALPVLTKLAENMKAPLGGQASSAEYGIGLTITYALLGFFSFICGAILYSLRNRRSIGVFSWSSIRMNQTDRLQLATSMPRC